MPTAELCRTDWKRRLVVALLQRVVRPSTQLPSGIVGLLQRLKESEQSVIRLETRWLGSAVRLELRQGCFFECKVSVQIGLRGLYRLMAEPQRRINTRLKQFHRSAVP